MTTPIQGKTGKGKVSHFNCVVMDKDGNILRLSGTNVGSLQKMITKKFKSPCQFRQDPDQPHVTWIYNPESLGPDGIAGWIATADLPEDLVAQLADKKNPTVDSDYDDDFDDVDLAA